MAKSFDVFISHASEDKSTLVRNLALELSSRGYRVWYDEFTLSVGNGLRQSIDRGICDSRYGIVVLSESFFAKGWANYELDGLVQLNIDNPGVILPIWHNVKNEEVAAYSPSLANIIAIQTDNRTISDLANLLERTIGDYRYLVDEDESISRSREKTTIDAKQREAGFQVLISKQTDQFFNTTDSACRSDRIIFPYSDSYSEHPFHFWQNEPGKIRLIRHVVYDLTSENFISTENEIIKNDGCHLISIVRFSRKSPGPIRIVCDVTTTNGFKGLFDDGLEYVEFNNQSRIEHFVYNLRMPNTDDFRRVKIYAENSLIKPKIQPDSICVNHIIRPILPGTKLRFSLINEKITSVKSRKPK